MTAAFLQALPTSPRAPCTGLHSLLTPSQRNPSPSQGSAPQTPLNWLMALYPSAIDTPMTDSARVGDLGVGQASFFPQPLTPTWQTLSILA